MIIASPARLGAPASFTKYPIGWYPSSSSEAAAFVESYLKFTIEQSKNLDTIFNALAKWAALGVATCDDLDRYNSYATELYYNQLRIKHALAKLGSVYAERSEVPFPRLFAHNVSRKRDGTVKIDLQCSNGYPVAGLQINPGMCAPSGLGVVVSGGAAGLAFALLAVGIGGWLLGQAFSVIIKSLPQNLVNDLNRQMHEDRTRRDAKRAKDADDCFERMVAALPQSERTHGTLQQITQQCMIDATKKYPDRPPPKVEASDPIGTIGKAILYGGLGVAVIVGSVAAYKAFVAE